MKVLLVAIHPYPSPQAVPLANAFLAGYLSTDPELAARIEVELRDFFVGDDPAACADELLAGEPDAVGFSVYLWNRDEARAIAGQLREKRPCVRLFAGGPEPTADPEGVFREMQVDFLVMGEGEIPFLDAMGQLCDGRTMTSAPGVAVRGGDPVQGGGGRWVEDLASIPSPYLTGIISPEPGGGLLWQLSRGCDFACSFCYDQKGIQGVRRFSLQRLEAELDWFARKRVAQVFVLDSTFNRDVKRAKEILRLIGKKAPHIHFHFEVRSEFLDAELAHLFAGLNCSIQIGLQSADPQVQRGVRRHFDPADFAEKVSLLNGEGAVFGFDLIYGLPGDTLDGFRESLAFALGLYPNHLDIFPLAVLPGTELAERADTLGIDRLTSPPYTVLGTPAFPPADMRDAARIASACDIFYSRGKAVAWFNSVMAALGCRPSELLLRFADQLGEGSFAEQDFPDDEIWRMQRAFLERLFFRENLHHLLPAALDLVDYHYHYAAALLAPQPELPTDRMLAQMDLLGERFGRAPGARLVRFHYEVFDILEAGEIDLSEFTACFSPVGSCAVIYPRGGDVFTESLVEPYFLLLERLDGKIPAGEAASALGIPADEAASFLEFAAAEGIVLLPAGP